MYYIYRHDHNDQMVVVCCVCAIHKLFHQISHGRLLLVPIACLCVSGWVISKQQLYHIMENIKINAPFKMWKCNSFHSQSIRSSTSSMRERTKLYIILDYIEYKMYNICNIKYLIFLPQNKCSPKFSKP